MLCLDGVMDSERVGKERNGRKLQWKVKLFQLVERERHELKVR